MTGEDLGCKLGVVEKVKFEYSPLGEALNNKAKCKTDQIDQTGQIDKTGKRDKYLFYNPKYSFERNLKISVILKKCHLILCIKGCKIFIKKLLVLKKLSQQTKKTEDLKAEVLDNAGDLLNELHYITMKNIKKKKMI